MSVPILIPHASGTNRDLEAAQAIELVGGTPTIAHVNELRSGAVRIADYAAILLPGGFSYGDALGAGGRLALELRTWFADELAAAAQASRPMLGICNGFQVLVQAGLLPGPMGGTTIRCPIAHGEGRVAGSDDSAAARLEEGLVAFRYLADGARPTSDDPVAAGGVYPANPNGSVNDIAGICDDTGNIVGLMPHPEDHVLDWQRPSGPEGGSGLPLFEAFVAAAR